MSDVPLTVKSFSAILDEANDLPTLEAEIDEGFAQLAAKVPIQIDPKSCQIQAEDTTVQESTEM